MTVDETRAKAKQDKCGRCAGAMSCSDYGGPEYIGCLLSREKHWECEGPYNQREIFQIIEDED